MILHIISNNFIFLHVFSYFYELTGQKKEDDLKPATKPKVLLVEDNPDSRKLLTSLFRKRLGLTLSCAASVNEAEEKLSATQFDLIISDLRMPEKDGFDMLRLVIEQQHSAPFLFYSAEDISRDTLRRFDYPVIAVKKPQHQELLNLASDLLGVPFEKKGPT